MLGFGPPADRQAQREWWRRQLQRQQQSQMTVAEFCRRHCILAVTFYSWKRRSRTTRRPQPHRAQCLSHGHAARTRGPAFRRRLCPCVDRRRASGGGLLEIEFGNACTVRRKGTVDPKLLRDEPGQAKNDRNAHVPIEAHVFACGGQAFRSSSAFHCTLFPTLLQREGRGVVVDHQAHV